MCDQTRYASILSFFPSFLRSKQENNPSRETQITLPRPPSSNDVQAWRDYWIEQGLLWRTEPEIDLQRQKQLAECRSITPDITKGIYPYSTDGFSSICSCPTPQVWVTAIEAVLGLLIEGVFIAMLTQRFFGK